MALGRKGKGQMGEMGKDGKRRMGQRERGDWSSWVETMQEDGLHRGMWQEISKGVGGLEGIEMNQCWRWGNGLKGLNWGA